MSLELLNLLSGADEQFARGLVELGWYDYAPVLTSHDFMGKARARLNPQFRSAGEVGDTDAWVYRLDLPGGKWQDAAAVVESHLKQEPQFAVVFCNLPGALLILVPSNPDKAFGKAKSGLTVDRIYLDTRQPSNFETETIRKLVAAPKSRFRSRLQEMVNTERVTKKFYDRFKKELDSFKTQIEGISVESDKLWYSSVMLNRLMFVYFLQRKGYLNGDCDYLSNRLKMVRERRGMDKFQSFYRCFLLRLFQEGLGSRQRESDFEGLLGKIPYLNGGLFELHDIENRYADTDGETLIDIPDDAFESVFSFFNDYEWCLDTRPSRTEKEINPDVLGYIFEKYINQKQMGAYYTREDITEYISKNTIIPYLFDSAAKKHKAAFEGDDSVWLLLQIDPDRYIYDAVQKGVELELPAEIACGLDDVSQRGKWNTPAPEEYALPTEIWREVVARRKRYAEVRGKLERGEIRSIDDLITLNLNIIQFARDVIDITDGPELIRAIWNTVAGRIPEIGSNASPIPPMTVLDPTCGSGAFLFAALNILEPLYEGCLDRMQMFVTQADSDGDSRKYPDFRSVLARMNDTTKHPNREYFILKSIILNNLYGVDIMEEAVEICKLRLFLKMASVVEPDETKDNYGLEPLPDIDFNIRAGNTLVGFATEEEVRQVTAAGKDKQLTMLPDGYSAEQMELIGNIDESFAFKRIKDKLAVVDAAYELFRRQQMEFGGEVTAEDKQALQKKLWALDDELNRYLAAQYGIDSSRHDAAYTQWLESHKPFHWFMEFYGIMRRGGFDVIIGNPPYVEYAKVKADYTVSSYDTLDCANLYAYVLERSGNLLSLRGRLGEIVPIASVSVSETRSLRKYLLRKFDLILLSSFAIRPAKLFEGVEQRLTIVLAADLRGSSKGSKLIATSKYNQWFAVERPALFSCLEYCTAENLASVECIPKVGSEYAASVLARIQSQSEQIERKLAPRGPAKLYFHRTPGYWIRAMDFLPYFKSPTANRSVHHIRELEFARAEWAKFAGAILSSSLYFFAFFAVGNCRNLTLDDVKTFPMGKPEPQVIIRACTLFDKLTADLQAKSEIKRRGLTEFQEFNWGLSKPIVDQIDELLAVHYGLDNEMRDFIVNYDIKYRIEPNGDATEGEE